MAQLAQHRALACVAALATLGIERSRLFVTYEGMSGNIRTDFIPHSLLPYAPMPGGDFGACAVIIEGTTSERGHTIRVPFHAGSALYVDVSSCLLFRMKCSYSAWRLALLVSLDKTCYVTSLSLASAMARYHLLGR